MSAPLIWIVLPGIVAILVFVLYRWRWVSFLFAFLIATLLFILAILLPPGRELTLGPLEINIAESLGILGREAVIGPTDIPEVLIIFWGVALWIGAGYFAQAPRYFPGIALGMAALQVAAITIQPFLYAAVFIELLAVLSIPLLVEIGQQVRQGVLRLIIYYTLGMAAILFVGWMLTTGDQATAEGELLFTAAILLVIGFILLLAVFPAHSWVPMILRRGNPYPSAFVVFWLTQSALLFGNGLLDQYDLIGSGTLGSQVMVVIGVLIIFVFGAFLVFQHDLARIIGLTIQIEIGFALLAVAVQAVSGETVFYALLFLKSLPFVLLALSATLLSVKSGSLDFSAIRGAGAYFRWSSVGAIVSFLAILGLPLLPIFPIKMVVMQTASFSGEWLYLGVMLGTAGLLICLLKFFSVLYPSGYEQENSNDDQSSEHAKAVKAVESKQIKLVIGLAILLLFVSGLISGAILPTWM